MKTSYVKMPSGETIVCEAFRTWTRRNRIIRTTKHNPCPKCKSPQVHLINSALLAKWKCRECKHQWRWEPLILIRSN